MPSASIKYFPADSRSRTRSTACSSAGDEADTATAACDWQRPESSRAADRPAAKSTRRRGGKRATGWACCGVEAHAGSLAAGIESVSGAAMCLRGRGQIDTLARSDPPAGNRHKARGARLLAESLATPPPPAHSAPDWPAPRLCCSSRRQPCTQAAASSCPLSERTAAPHTRLACWTATPAQRTLHPARDTRPP